MIRGVILDLDGTVYRSDSVVPGAPEAVARLRDRGCRVLFCSNNPTKTPAEYAERLAGMGIEADTDLILPASTVTRDFLRANYPDEPTYVVGAESLRRYVADSGQPLVDDARDATVFVASWDEAFDYGDMCAALDGVDAETAFIGTDPDRTIPTEEGFVPGSGAIIGAVARTVGREPDRVLGKPAEETGEDALERLGVAPEECLVVGDRLDTDLALGAQFGMTTALVLTGVSSPGDVEHSAVDPDYVLDSVADVDEVLDREGTAAD